MDPISLQRTVREQTETMHAAISDVGGWLSKIDHEDKELIKKSRHQLSTGSGKDIPPIRGTTSTQISTQTQVMPEPETDDSDSNSKRIPSTDYDAWSKFDPDSQLKRQGMAGDDLKQLNELFDASSKSSIGETVPMSDTKPSKKGVQITEIGDDEAEAETEKKEKELKDKLMKEKKLKSEAESESEMVIREKDKGNLHFRAGEYTKALSAYALAIALNLGSNAVSDASSKQIDASEPRDAEIHSVLFSNRAQALINLGRFDEAIGEATDSISYNIKNVKAHVRRGTAYMKKKMYSHALDDFRYASRMDTSNMAIKKQIQAAKKALRTAASAAAEKEEKRGKVKVAIEEVGDGDGDKEEKKVVEETKVEKVEVEVEVEEKKKKVRVEIVDDNEEEEEQEEKEKDKKETVAPSTPIKQQPVSDEPAVVHTTPVSATPSTPIQPVPVVLPSPSPSKYDVNSLEIPKTIFEFDRVRAMLMKRKDEEGFYEYMKRIPLAGYQPITNPLEYDIFVSVLLILSKYYVKDELYQDIASIMLTLSKADRFGTQLMFLEPGDRNVVDGLLQVLGEHEAVIEPSSLCGILKKAFA